MVCRKRQGVADVVVVCIDGLESSPPKAAVITHTIEAVLPTQAAPPPVVAPPKAEPEFFSTGSEVMDDILEHSQQRMLEAFSHLSKRIDGLSGHRHATERSQPLSTDLG